MKNKDAEEEKFNGLSLDTVVFLFLEMRNAEHRNAIFQNEDTKNEHNAYKEILERLELMKPYEKFKEHIGNLI